MDTGRFAIVVFTLLALFVIYLDNAGKLKEAVNAARGVNNPASLPPVTPLPAFGLPTTTTTHPVTTVPIFGTGGGLVDG